MNNDMAALHNAAIALLAKREYSRKELEMKLLRRNPTPQDLQTVLDALIENNYQSDDRFAEVFIRQRIATGKGPYAIKQQLALKGIDRDLIAQKLSEADVNWFDAAEDVYLKKYRGEAVVDQKDRAKRQRFMLSRGFSPAIVSEIL